MEPTTARVLRRSAGASVLYGILFVVSLPFLCLLGLPTAAVLTRLIGRQLEGLLFGGARQSARPMAGFLFIYVFTVAVVLASVGGTTAVQTFLPEAAQLLATALGCTGALVLLLAVALPYAFVPLVERDPAIPSAIGGHSFLLAARAMTHLPVARRVALVATTAAAFLVPLLLFLILERERELGWGLLATALAVALLVPLSTAHYVAAYGQVRERLEREPLEDDPVALPAIVRAASASAVVSGIGLVALLAGAALAPSSMHVSHDAPAIFAGDPQPAVLPGTDVIVRAAGQGVTVAARDGGGVGHVTASCGTVEAITITELEGPEFLIRARCAGNAVREMRVDVRGVRRDDGLVDRVRARTGGCFWALLVLTALAWAFALGGPWRSLQQVRHLRSLARSDDAEAAGDLRAFEGTLRASEPVTLDGRRFRSGGSAQVIGPGSLRVTLPAEGPALGAEEGSLLDGAPVAVVGRFERGVGAGLREGAAPWPEGGRLIPGGRRAAAERLTARASRNLAAVLAALALAQVAAAIVLTLSW